MKIETRISDGMMHSNRRCFEIQSKLPKLFSFDFLMIHKTVMSYSTTKLRYACTKASNRLIHSIDCAISSRISKMAFISNKSKYLNDSHDEVFRLLIKHKEISRITWHKQEFQIKMRPCTDPSE